MKQQTYTHPNETSRLTIKRQRENIVTCNLIDKPKEYKAGSDRYGYQVIICDINNLKPTNTTAQ